MKLSESKLFAIEALNSIENLEWPEWAQFVEIDVGNKVAVFKRLIDGKTAHMRGINVPPERDWAGCWWVSVTRDEFESVDGWVRNDGVKPNIADVCRVDLTLRDGNAWPRVIVSDLNWGLDNSHDDIIKWRYHKQPQKQVEQPTQQPESNIDTLISQHKAARLSTLEARRQLERAEAVEHSLLLSIEAWAESQGFNIRLLDESEEKPELVITDWRDLRVGDVIWWSGDSSYDAGEYPVVRVEIVDYANSMPILLEIHSDMREWVNVDEEQWKFIRRPAK